MIRVKLNHKFFLFLCVGLVAAAVHWLSRYFLSVFTPFSIAVVIAYAVGMITAFYLNKRFVFPESDRDEKKQIRDFIIINLSFFPVVWGISLLLVFLLPSIGLVIYVEEISHAIAIAVPMFITYFLYKFIAFKV